MRKSRQNNFNLSDEYFSKLDEWNRSEDKKEATRKRVGLSIRRQKVSYRPYFATIAVGVLFSIIVLSLLPTHIAENNQAYKTSNVIKMSGEKMQEYHLIEESIFYKTKEVLVATVNVTPGEIKYEGIKQRKFNEVTIYYEKSDEDILNMAFHLDGSTYIIKHYLSHKTDETEAFTLAQELIEELKNKR